MTSWVLYKFTKFVGIKRNHCIESRLLSFIYLYFHEFVAEVGLLAQLIYSLVNKNL